MISPERIEERLRARGWSQAELARRVGVKATSIWKLVTGLSSGSKHLHRIASELGTTPEYLLGETDDPSPMVGQVREAPMPPVAPDMVYLQSIDLRFGLGGAIMDSEIDENRAEVMAFPSAWLRMITTSPPNMLFWARGQGNSMNPTINDGDVILIDRSQSSLRFNDLCWAFAYGDIGMVKRLRQMPSGSVKILSDNPSVLPEIAYDGELTLFGRVIAVVRML